MSKFVKNIISGNRNTQQAQATMQCNYANNYYGDQVCVPTYLNQQGNKAASQVSH